MGVLKPTTIFFSQNRFESVIAMYIILFDVKYDNLKIKIITIKLSVTIEKIKKTVLLAGFETIRLF